MRRQKLLRVEKILTIKQRSYKVNFIKIKHLLFERHLEKYK